MKIKLTVLSPQFLHCRFDCFSYFSKFVSSSISFSRQDYLSSKEFERYNEHRTSSWVMWCEEALRFRHTLWVDCALGWYFVSHFSIISTFYAMMYAKLVYANEQNRINHRKKKIMAKRMGNPYTEWFERMRRSDSIKYDKCKKRPTNIIISLRPVCVCVYIIEWWKKAVIPK